jgi:hypothetical protein
MEMQTVIRAVLDRVELRAPRSRPERTRVHHVTMVPAAGGRVVVSERRPAPVPS